MERSFRPRPRNVEPLLYPMCLVKVAKPSEHWWVAWYLPDLDSVTQVQQVLYEHRVTIDPSRQAQLTEHLCQLKEDLAFALYQRLGSTEMDLDDASGPVWLLMGPHATTLSFRHVQRYLSVADAAFLTQMAELTQIARHNPDLQQALQDYRDYHQWTKRQNNLTKVLDPPKWTTRTTSVSLDHGDSATVVTNASLPLEESPAVEVTEPKVGKRKDSRARSKSRPRSSKRPKKSPKSSPESVARPKTTVKNTTPPSNQPEHVTPRHTKQSNNRVGDNSATKFNHEALAEANG